MQMSNTTDKEQEVNTEMDSATKSYELMEKTLMGSFKQLQANQGQLPKKFIGQDDDYEDFVLQSADSKHKAIELWRDSLGSYESLSADLDYFTAQLKLYVAESFLSEHGFDRATDALRDSFVKSNKKIKELIKLKGKLESLSGASERLVRAFESDEVNCRRLLERKNKLTGF